MKQVLLVSVMTVFVSMAAPASAQSNDNTPEELAVEGIAKLMDALGVFIQSIPQYEMPEMNEDGDIIIRRKRSEEDEKTDPKLEETST
ncbi:MAG: hypothetical protein V7723_00455 [Sneathiella sp.]|uniref:hypothetical protein n=1 Tax=Sneathiella sp. TaxID=1964365 RepID=UPI0030034490